MLRYAQHDMGLGYFKISTSLTANRPTRFAATLQFEPAQSVLMARPETWRTPLIISGVHQRAWSNWAGRLAQSGWRLPRVGHQSR